MILIAVLLMMWAWLAYEMNNAPTLDENENPYKP